MGKSNNAVTAYLAAEVMEDFLRVVVPHYGLSKAATLETLVRDAVHRITGEQTKGKQLEALLNKMDALAFRLEAAERRQQIILTLLWALVLKDQPSGTIGITAEQVQALQAFGAMVTEQG